MARTITFEALLKRVFYRLRQVYEVSPTADQIARRQQIAQMLSDACREFWDKWPWPEAVVELEDFTLVDGYSVPYASILNASWAEIWTANPAENREARRLDFVFGTAGLELIKPWAQDVTTVFVRCRPDAPEFSYVVHDDAADYLRGDVVFDPATKQCYAALVDDPGTDLQEEADWSLQTVLEILSAAMVYEAQAQLMSSQGTSEVDLALQNQLRGKAQDSIEQQWLLLKQTRRFG